MLLALDTISRVAELCSISYKSVKFNRAGVSFSFYRLKKSQRKGPLQFYSLSRFNGLNCRVACLETYVSVTKNLRSKENVDALFLSVRRPVASFCTSLF